MREEIEAMTRAVIGEHVQIPLNMIFQGIGSPGKYGGIFQFQHDPKQVSKLLEGANPNTHHVLLIGDAFIRTRIVAETKKLMGSGYAGLATSGFIDMDAWLKDGKVLKGGL